MTNTERLAVQRKRFETRKPSIKVEGTKGRKLTVTLCGEPMRFSLTSPRVGEGKNILQYSKASAKLLLAWQAFAAVYAHDMPKQVIYIEDGKIVSASKANY